MNEDPKTQAALLLTVSLGKADRGGAKPLSPGEWARLEVWLEARDLDLSELVTDDVGNLLAGWEDRTIAPGRLDYLLGRGAAVGLALEKWRRAGLWILSPWDDAYPERFRRRLGRTAPPVLFGCGNKALVRRGGLAVVGSRDAEDDDIAFSRTLGESASLQGFSIVSGGARGVDRSAMKGALDKDGTVVAVLADNLLRAATSTLYRRPLLSGDIALVCTVNPEARFHVGNAMARNRYIYCLADAAVVVASARGSGGTWSGACENAKAGWVPLWVRKTDRSGSGNPDLVASGARWLPDPLQSLAALFEPSEAATSPVPAALSEERHPWYTPDAGTAGQLGRELPPPAIPKDLNFFDLFLIRLEGLTADEPLTESDIAERLRIVKVQVREWLDRGVSGGSIEKVERPVRYRAPNRVPPLPLDTPAPVSSSKVASPAVVARLDFEHLFQARIEEMTAGEPRSSSDIARAIRVSRGQVNKWLSRGVAEGRIGRQTKPTRYRAAGDPCESE